MITVFGRGRMWTLVLQVSVPLLVIAPRDASAQVVATSFEELQSLIKRGDTIEVKDANGRKVKGRLGELSTSALELLVRKTGPDGRETFAPQARLSERDVQQVVLERRDSRLNGTLIGFAPGATIGVLILFAGAGCDCYTVESRAPIALWTIAIAGGLGAALGAGIDSSIHKHRTVFFRPAGRSSGLQVSPLLSTSAAGIRVSMRF